MRGRHAFQPGCFLAKVELIRLLELYEGFCYQLMNALREFFEKLADHWDSSQSKNREAIIHTLLKQFDESLSQSGRILNVGSGTGALIPILSQRYPRAQITSLDFAHQMCRRAAQRTSSDSIVQGDVHKLPFEHWSFDTVICHNSFPHFTDQWLALENFKRVLTRSGSLLILHDISRERVNEIHANAQAKVIHQDLLPGVKDLSKCLKSLGFSLQFTEDTDIHYIIYAKKH